MKNVTMRFGVVYYAVLMLFLLPGSWAIVLELVSFVSRGSFKSDILSLFGAITCLLVLLFVSFRVAPAYRVVLSDAGIMMSHRVTIFGIKIFDLSADARWDNVTLVWHSIGWHWGLALIVPVKDSYKTVWLNRSFTSRKEALRFAVTKVPAWRISDEAKRKLSRMGLDSRTGTTPPPGEPPESVAT